MIFLTFPDSAEKKFFQTQSVSCFVVIHELYSSFLFQAFYLILLCPKGIWKYGKTDLLVTVTRNAWGEDTLAFSARRLKKLIFLQC